MVDLNLLYLNALLISNSSHDEQTKVGALLIDKKTGNIMQTGYNGFVRGAPDSSLPKTRPEKHRFIIHAEKNLLFNCARQGVATKDCAVFVTLSPCKDCTRAMYQSGIDTIYFKDKYKDFDEQINMGDLNVEVTKIGEFTKLVLSPISGVFNE